MFIYTIQHCNFELILDSTVVSMCAVENAFIRTFCAHNQGNRKCINLDW